MSLPTAVCLAGPTAVGKTELALALAREFPAEIISVDSVQVYRGLDIGTAKPSAEIRATVPHHLIDIRDPQERYSAAAFRDDALALITSVAAAGRVPVLVGGTLLYFRALMQGLAPMPPADLSVRAELDARGAREGWPALHAELATVDPAAAGRIAPADRQRIQRALEVFALSGRPLTEWQNAEVDRAPVNFCCLALLPGDRSVLHERIAARFQLMLEAGLLDEVSRLRALPGMHAALPAARAVGYRQLWQHLEGLCTLERAVTDAITATRRYAKRQLTWLRNEPDFKALHTDQAQLSQRALRTLKAAGALDAISGFSR
ncbi:MAG: tRNA (adenosine(37)-N6)-dimethylallyltransferase MiaA [Gammaproteobacteria bacterium]